MSFETIVVFTEKPSVATTVAGVLGATERHKGYYQGNGYRVTWAFGHLVTLDEPETMNPAWGGRWAMNTLPMIPEHWRYRVADKAELQFAIIKNLFLAPETKTIINAGDAGREGQLIFDLIYKLTGSRVPVQRLWTSSLTDEAIRAAMHALKPASAFAALSAAAALRQQWDWMNGLSTTRAYTILNGQKCTAGRVQTPTLALIVERQHVIEHFKPEEFYEIEADVHTPPFKAKYTERDGEQFRTRVADRAKAETILRSVSKARSAIVAELQTTEKTSPAPALFNLLALQKEANQRFGFTAQETMDLAQSLYEEYKLLSYPRTESRHLSPDMLAELPGVLDTLSQLPAACFAAVKESLPVIAGQLVPAAQQALAALRGGLSLSKSYVDAGKLTDHHAILVTYKHPPADLPKKQACIYYLVAARFTAIFLPAEIRDETVVALDIAAHPFRATGSIVRSAGWTILRASEKQGDDRQKLPPLTKGQEIAVNEILLKPGKTTPPKPYDDASLLTAMKNAGANLEDEDLVKAMKASGLGTPATRAAIIEKLFASGYTERKLKAIVATPKGVAFITQVHPKLKDVALTAEWEKQLKEIEDNELSSATANAAFLSFLQELFPQIAAAAPAAMPDTDDPNAYGVCPQCRNGTVRKTRRGAGCSRYKEGCTFSIWGEVGGKSLTVGQIRQLVNKRRTKLIKGFTSKNSGKQFHAYLILNAEFKIKYEFENKA